MDAEQRQFLIERHHGSIALHGYSPHALFWTSRGLQKIRFKVISEIGIAAGDSLLDVGCGFADLQSWLLGHNIPVVYTGLDLSPEMISAAEKMHPKAVLLCGELFDFEFAPASFDWLVLSGTLNWQLNDGGEYARRGNCADVRVVSSWPCLQYAQRKLPEYAGTARSGGFRA